MNDSSCKMRILELFPYAFFSRYQLQLRLPVSKFIINGVYLYRKKTDIFYYPDIYIYICVCIIYSTVSAYLNGVLQFMGSIVKLCNAGHESFCRMFIWNRINHHVYDRYIHNMSASSHYLSQCWDIVGPIGTNSYHWNVNQANIFSFKKMFFENFVSKMVAFSLGLIVLTTNALLPYTWCCITIGLWLTILTYV